MFTEEQLHHPLLTHEQEVALGHRIQAGDCDALDELIRHNLRLVYKLARRFYTDDPGTEFDDLVQEGMMGLLTAAQKYDPDRNNRFVTYAHWWIRKRIQRAALTAGAIRRHANPNQPRSNPNAIRNHALRQASIIRLDAPLRDRRGDDSENTLADILGDNSLSVEEQALSAIEVERILTTLRLNERGQAIVRDWLAGIPRSEVQRIHGVSRSWIHAIVETKLRDRKDMFMPRESTPNCIEPGCDQPKYVNESGTKYARCHDHQKEFWAAAARAKSAANRHREAEPAKPRTFDHSFEELKRGVSFDAAMAVVIKPGGRFISQIAAPASVPLVEQKNNPTAIVTDERARACVQAIDILGEDFPEVIDLVDVLMRLNRRKANGHE